jgi:two-component system sensor histidine kinase DesK
LSFRGAEWFNRWVPTVSEPPVRDLKRFHRYTYWSLVLTGPFGLFIAAMFFAGEAPGNSMVLWGSVGGIIVALGFATAVLWLFAERSGERMQRRLRWAGWAVVAAGAGLGTFDVPISAAWIVPVAVLEAGRLLWTGSGRYLRRTTVSCATVIAAVAILLALDLVGGYAMFLALVLMPALLGGVLCQWWFYEVAERIDDARQLAGELAVAEERLRFAAELHDIQGGHLQAITLKTQLARRLVTADPDRAVAELEAVEDLARQALKDTREVVGGYRKVTLADEIDSAARILRSAGIQAAVRADVPPLIERTERLLGLLVREATTNMLRHSRASAAELAVTADHGTVAVTVANDGAGDPGGERGNGIAMLGERFAEAGGTVEYEHRKERFTLTGTLPLSAEGER